MSSAASPGRTLGRLVGARLLQVVGDSDATHDNLAALELHRRLDRDGLEVRTLALAPGAVGGLSSVLPTMAPSGRSLAAHTQLRREQRWADVVLLRGPVAATAAGLARMRAAPATVLLLEELPAAWLSAPLPSRVLRCLGALDRLVVTDESDIEAAGAFCRDVRSVVAIPIGAEATALTTDAQRSAARDRLGIAADGVVVHIVTDERTCDRDLGGLVSEVEAAGAVWTSAPRADDRLVRFGADGGDSAGERMEASEMAIAAADLVVVAGSTAGPPLSLIGAMSSGLAPVGLGPDDVGFASVEEAVGSGRPAIRRCGAAAAALVRERFALDVVAPRWHELLSAFLGPDPDS